MPTTIHGPSSKPRGREHRARLRELLDLRPGARLPKQIYLGAVLGIDESQAGRHLRRVLAEDGISTHTARGRRHGVYVASSIEGMLP